MDADFLEQFIDHLKVKHTHWLFDHVNEREHQTVIADFIRWCIDEHERDLHGPRGKDGKSFFQRRAEATSSQSGS